MKRRIHLIMLALALLCLPGCPPAADRTPYPLDRSLDLAAAQQRDFVDSFLQGRWCEAESLYAECMEAFIRHDEFVRAARTARLAARLKAYLGLDAPDELAAAKRMETVAGTGPEAVPERDGRYAALVEDGRFAELASQLEQEDDALYVSVYARKGAAAALERGQAKQADALWERARATDAAQGWVALLREDWRLRLAMESDPLKRGAIDERIRILDERIVPCP